MKINFVARVNDSHKKTTGAYILELDLSFVPTVGMKLKGGTSTWLWETVNGNELDPQIQEIVYNMDEEKLYCLFEIDESLASSRWNKIQDLNSSYELYQFETHN